MTFFTKWDRSKKGWDAAKEWMFYGILALYGSASTVVPILVMIFLLGLTL